VDIPRSANVGTFVGFFLLLLSFSLFNDSLPV
jgi:hypothetical protein